jgi:hypothetical protein
METQTRIFDAGKGYGSLTSLRTLVDCTVAKYQGRWWMFACGVEFGSPEINLFSASLPAIAQNPSKPSRWGQLARNGHEVVQFKDVKTNRFVAVAVDGEAKEFGGGKSRGQPAADPD